MPTTPEPKKTTLPERLGRIVSLAALAIIGAQAWGAASCAFDAQGRQIPPAAAKPANPNAQSNWGGLGGTGIHAATTAKPGQDDGWGGIGGTGIKQPGPMPANMLADRATEPGHEGWGGMGGTGLGHAPVGGQPHLAGYVLFVSGQTTARQGDLPVRKLARGDAICEGDTIKTPAGGMLQIRMADQGAVMLYAGSQLHIDTFKLPAKIDGSEHLTMTLAEGGMRAVTGEIGHVNKENYLIKTPTAQIHIRGTDHEVFQVPATGGRFANIAAGTYNHVLRGGTTLLNNEGGSVRLDPAQSGFSPLHNGLPHVLEALPEVLRAMPLRSILHQTGSSSTGKIETVDAGVTSPLDPLKPMPTRIVSNNVTLNFDVDPLPSPPLSAYAGVTSANDNVQLGAIDGKTDDDMSGSNDPGWRIGVHPDKGVPLYAVLADTNAPSDRLSGRPLFYADDSTTQRIHYDTLKFDGIQVYWGIYSGGATVDVNGDWQAADWHAYAFAPGGSTPLSVIQNLSGSTSYNYASIGATPPIDNKGNAGGQLNSLSMKVTFGADPKVSDYNINVTDGLSRVWNASSTGPVSLSDFKNGQMQLNGSCTGCVSNTVTGTAAGVLIGNTAGGAISSYTLQTNQNESVSGVAVLAKPKP